MFQIQLWFIRSIIHFDRPWFAACLTLVGFSLVGTSRTSGAGGGGSVRYKHSGLRHHQQWPSWSCRGNNWWDRDHHHHHGLGGNDCEDDDDLDVDDQDQSKSKSGLAHMVSDHWSPIAQCWCWQLNVDDKYDQGINDNNAANDCLIDNKCKWDMYIKKSLWNKFHTLLLGLLLRHYQW